MKLWFSYLEVVSSLTLSTIEKKNLAILKQPLSREFMKFSVIFTFENYFERGSRPKSKTSFQINTQKPVKSQMHISTVNTKFMFPPLNKKVDQPYIFWKILCKFMLKHASHDFKVFMTRIPLTVSLCFAHQGMEISMEPGGQGGRQWFRKHVLNKSYLIQVVA